MIQWWQGLATRQKVGFASVVALLVLLAVGSAYWMLKPEFVPVADAAAPEENAALVTSLESLGASYKVDPKSGAVLVPADQLQNLKSRLALRGPAFRSPVGFELFNNSDFGMTEFSQKINYQRGLEGELTRTIMSLEGVRYARVHLVLPDSSLFRKDQEQAKASVTLMSKGESTLPQAQIEGIARLVAAAVPGLKPEAVSIHDYRGMDLSGGSPVGTTDADTLARSVRDQEMIETRLEAKVYELLKPMFPSSPVAVSVDVQLRMDKVTSSRQDTTLEAPKATELSQLRNQLLGPASGESDASQKGEPGSPLATLAVHADAIVHHGVQYSEQVEKAPGSIERLSIGVLVPSELPAGVSVTQLQDLVAAAAGIDTRRSDRIAVYAVENLGRTTTGVNTAQPAAQPGMPSGNPRLVEKAVWPAETWYALAAAGLLLALGAFAAGRRAGEPRLTRMEREKLVDQVRRGLAAGDEKGRTAE